MKHSGQLATCVALAMAVSLGGCATKKFTRTEVGVVDAKIQATQGQVDAAQTTIGQHETHLGQLDAQAREALQRADAAGKLAEGKFNYSVVLTDDAIKFAANGSKLTPEAESRLMSLADKLKSDNKNVYVEVQGHTDKSEAARLGAQRAEAVRMFLARQGVALNRIATISYGSSAPADTSNTRAGRAMNRRVVVILMS